MPYKLSTYTNVAINSLGKYTQSNACAVRNDSHAYVHKQGNIIGIEKLQS